MSDCDLDPIRVATWNLWWRFGRWEARAEAIRSILHEARPDICGLQEVWADGDDNLARTLAADLGLHWTWAASPEPERWQKRLPGSSADAGLAILARWPLNGVAQHALPSGDSGDVSRFALAAMVESPYGRIPVATTQLTAAPWDSAARGLQVRALARLVADRQGADFPPVLVGDLNAEPDSDELRLLCGHKTAPAVDRLVLVDAWRYADPNAVGWTWDRANPDVRATMEPSARIDYVLVGIPGADGRGHVVSARRLGADPVDGVWPSDHAGVVAELAVSR